MSVLGGVARVYAPVAVWVSWISLGLTLIAPSSGLGETQ